MHPFVDLTIDQLLSIMAGIVGVVMMLMAMHRDQQSEYRCSCIFAQSLELSHHF